MKVKILLTFFCLSFPTYCFPILVMQATSYYGVSHSEAGGLETYVNLTNMLASLCIFTIFLKFGYRRPIITASLLLALVSFAAKEIDSIWGIRLYLITTGVAYVVIKVACYSMVGLVVKTREGHARFVNFMEFIYMTANMIAMWIYSFFVGEEGSFWLYMFWFIAAVFVALAAMFYFTRIDESAIEQEAEKPLKEQLRDVGKIITTTAIILPLIMLWAYESIEQGVGPWMATFNYEILEAPKDISVQLGSLFVLAIALGRLYGSFIYKWVKWQYVFISSFIAGLFFICFVMFNMQEGIGANATSILDLPLVAYCLPIFGFFIGPVYPTLVSLMMTSHDKSMHSAIMCLILIAGAVFDSAAARAVGSLFGHFGGINAFAIYTIIPIVVLLILSLPYAAFLKKREARQLAAATGGPEK
ncbi:MAG: MFS transporter [Negativicutes bacterium]|nr:MFS transporter [Negativicutes bacterium]